MDASYSQRGGGVPCTQNELEKALHAVHSQIIPLQCVLHKEEKGNNSNKSILSYRPDLKPTLDIRELPKDYVKGEASPKYLEQLVAEEVTKGMGATPDDAYDKVLWRGIILEDGWVVLIFHHVICDGYSRGKIFVERLVEALAVNQQNTAPTVVEEKEMSKIELEPDAYQLLQEELFIRQGSEANSKERDAHAIDKDESQQLAPTKSCWPSPDDVSPVPNRYNQVPSTIIPNVSIIRQKCRVEDVTVTSMIIAALALSVRRQMNIPLPSEEVDMRKISWGVDIRRHLVSSSNYKSSNLFGCYVFSDNAEAECIPVKANDSVWYVAGLIHNAMANSSTSMDVAYNTIRKTKEQMEEPMTPEKLMPILSLIDGPDQGRNGALNVSNIGVVKGKSSCGTVRVDKLFSIASQNAIGSYAFMNTTTIDDNLFVTLASVWPTTSKERGRAMLDEFINILTDI